MLTFICYDEIHGNERRTEKKTPTHKKYIFQQFVRYNCFQPNKNMYCLLILITIFD